MLSNVPLKRTHDEFRLADRTHPAFLDHAVCSNSGLPGSPQPVYNLDDPKATSHGNFRAYFRQS